MINLIGLKSAIKPAKIQYSSDEGFRFAKSIQKPDVFVRSNTTTCPINFTGKSNRLKEYKKVTQDLNQTAQTAQSSLDKQLATEGWSGKTADAISILWNSKNRATLVQADIDKYKEEVTELDNSIKEDKFNDKFKEIFDVEFSHANILRYKNKSKQFENALTADCIAKYTDQKLSENIKTYNKLSGKLQDLNEYKTNPYATSGTMPYYNHFTTKEEIFDNMENSLVEVLGDKKVLDKILSANGLDSAKGSKDDKYRIYGYLSNIIVQSSKVSAKNCLKGQPLSQIKEDCDKAYKKAFGTKNDIIARVDQYNASQKAGSACIKFIANVVLNTLGPASIAGSCIYSIGKSIAFDVADAKSKDIDRDINYKELAINATLSGISGTINRIIVNEYAGDVASKILTGKTASNNIGTMLRDFVVKEIISKEGVKLPAYAVEEITSAVVKKMSGISKTKDSCLNQKELTNSIAVVSEAMTYLTIAKESGKLNNLSQKEMVALLSEHIDSSMKNNTNFNTWLNKNKTVFQELLNQLVKNELPKFDNK